MSFRNRARCKQLTATSNAQKTERTVVLLPETVAFVQPVAKAAVLLAARTLCGQLGLGHPSVAQILAATGASKSRAYEVCATLTRSLSTLTQPCGRPSLRAGASTSTVAGEDAITAAVLGFVLEHPGCAQAGDKRQRYSDDFRHFVVKLRTQYPDGSLDDFSHRTQVPLGTLKAWVAQPQAAPSPPPADEASNLEQRNVDGRRQEVAVAEIDAILAAWKTWRGTFIAFTEHVRHHLRLSIGRQSIANILQACGERQPRPRQDRSPDDLALRGAFETFFPGAQWVGDGKAVTVVVNGETITLNLELNVDAHTGAWVGISVRDEEDSPAVVEAFENAVATTGAPPLAELLDNKPSNHTPLVDAVLDNAGTLVIRATPDRPQNKAHVEGAFGLFSQQTPAIELDTNTSNKSIAHALLLLVATTFACAINHRPRADRDGRSRIALYTDEPTDDQIEAAKRALQERWRKQELARATREARQRPQVRALLDLQFEKLGLLDPKRHTRLAIGAYPLDAIIDGIAIFTAKRQAGTLPQEADHGHYLLGIVRNVAAKRELDCIAETLLAHRIEARDQAILILETQLQALEQSHRRIEDVINKCVCAALDAERKLDRIFWLTAVTQNLRQQENPAVRNHMYNAAARRINNTFRIPPPERQDALRFLADRLVPMN